MEHVLCLGGYWRNMKLHCCYYSPELVSGDLPLPCRRLSGGVQLPTGVPHCQAVHARRDQLHLLADHCWLHPQTGQCALTTQVKVAHAVTSMIVCIHILRIAIESQATFDLAWDYPSVTEDTDIVGGVAVT